jgi:nicotinate-nucleotide adenylyltransferase
VSTRASRNRILIVGGTFDPPHRAHVELAEIVAKARGCGRIVFVPAARSPHKTDEEPEATGAQRLEMLRIATRDVPGAEVSPIELDRGGVSYFVDTLAELREAFGTAAELHFMVGADQALAFKRWREPQRILALATPAVVLRPPWDAPTFATALRETFGEAESRLWAERVVEAPLVDVSATDLRERLRRGLPVEDAIDPKVLAYIRAHELYRLRAG